MNRIHHIELVLVLLFVCITIYFDHATFLGGIGDILAIFTVVYTWLNLARNEELEAIRRYLYVLSMQLELVPPRKKKQE
jgi:hypothetical protein